MVFNENETQVSRVAVRGMIGGAWLYCRMNGVRIKALFKNVVTVIILHRNNTIVLYTYKSWMYLFI